MSMSATSGSKTASAVDRTIHATFPQLPTDTPTSSSLLSSKGGGGADVEATSKNKNNNHKYNIELLHRINGTSILFQTTSLLRLSPSIYATSTTIFHRFYHRKSLLEYDVWGVCMASVLLACKITSGGMKISDVILVFVHVYRRMRLGIDCDDDDDDDDDDDSGDNGNEQQSSSFSFRTAYCSLLEKEREAKKKLLTQEERQNILRYVRPLPRNGLIYREWEEELVKMENVLLRELGFSLYWIPESHPHVFLLYFMKVLELVDSDDNNGDDNDDYDDNDNNNDDNGGTNGNSNINDSNGDNRDKNSSVKAGGNEDRKGTSIAQIAWNYCNDSCRLDLCVRYEPELIACAAIYLASLHEKQIRLPMEPRPWWYVFIGPGHDKDLSNVCNALLALQDENCIPGYKNAMRRYVISLVEGGSFNDPGSYSWNAID